MKSIHPSLLVVATLLNLLAIKFAAYLLPDRLYFSFSSFLFDDRSILKLEAVALKLALPLVTAFLIAAGVSRAQKIQNALRGQSPGLDAVIQDQLVVTLMYAAFLSAFLMAWPYILLWDVLIDPRIASQRLLFLMAYMAYFAGYAYFARAGVEAADAVFTPQPTSTPITLSTIAEHPMVKPVISSIGGMVASAIAAFLVVGLQ